MDDGGGTRFNEPANKRTDRRSSFRANPHVPQSRVRIIRTRRWPACQPRRYRSAYKRGLTERAVHAWPARQCLVGVQEKSIKSAFDEKRTPGAAVSINHRPCDKANSPRSARSRARYLRLREYIPCYRCACSIRVEYRSLALSFPFPCSLEISRSEILRETRMKICTKLW